MWESTDTNSPSLSSKFVEEPGPTRFCNRARLSSRANKATAMNGLLVPAGLLLHPFPAIAGRPPLDFSEDRAVRLIHRGISKDSPQEKFLTLIRGGTPMSDGREEREEREKRREQDERENREDRLDHHPEDPWRPERPES
jgi:hypothetical protein